MDTMTWIENCPDGSTARRTLSGNRTVTVRHLIGEDPALLRGYGEEISDKVLGQYHVLVISPGFDSYDSDGMSMTCHCLYSNTVHEHDLSVVMPTAKDAARLVDGLREVGL